MTTDALRDKCLDRMEQNAAAKSAAKKVERFMTAVGDFTQRQAILNENLLTLLRDVKDIICNLEARLRRLESKSEVTIIPTQKSDGGVLH